MWRSEHLVLQIESVYRSAAQSDPPKKPTYVPLSMDQQVLPDDSFVLNENVEARLDALKSESGESGDFLSILGLVQENDDDGFKYILITKKMYNKVTDTELCQIVREVYSSPSLAEQIKGVQSSSDYDLVEDEPQSTDLIMVNNQPACCLNDLPFLRHPIGCYYVRIEDTTAGTHQCLLVRETSSYETSSYESRMNDLRDTTLGHYGIMF